MNRKITTIVSSIIVGGLLISLGGAAIADSADGNTPKVKSFMIERKMQLGKMFKGRQDGNMFKGHPGERMKIKGSEGFKTQIDALVKDGTITQETADKMLALIEEKEAARKAEMEKFKNMTKEEMKAYFESKKDEKPAVRPEPFKEFVDAGILTQEQADTIKNNMQVKMQVKMEEMKAKLQEGLKTKLAALVEKNVITQDQVDKVLDYMNKAQEDRKAEMEKVKNMTPEERKTYFESMKGQKKGCFADMVADGVLTQEQADAIAKVLPFKGPRDEFCKGPGAGFHKGGKFIFKNGAEKAEQVE